MKELVQVFYEPGKVFDYVRLRGAWAAALIVTLIVFALGLVYDYQSIGAGNITRHALEQSKFAANMPPEAKEAAIAKADTTAGKTQNIGFACIGFLVVTLVFALLFLAIGNVGGGKIRFAQALGTVVYAGWPFAVIRFILSIIVISLAADKTELDPQRLLAFSPAAFMDKAATAKPLYALISAFDLFVFAQMAFAAFGLGRVAVISYTKALIGIVLIWALFTLIAMGFSLVF